MISPKNGCCPGLGAAVATFQCVRWPGGTRSGGHSHLNHSCHTTRSGAPRAQCDLANIYGEKPSNAVTGSFLLK